MNVSSLRYLALAGAAAGAVSLTACSDSSTGPVVTTAATLSVDTRGTTPGTSTPKYVTLGNPATIVTVATPSTSTNWDLKFNALAVAANGGTSGPGAVSVYCICENATKTNDQIKVLSSTVAGVAFDTIDASDIPAASAFEVDTLVPAITGWFTGTGTAAVANAASSWVVKTETGAGALAKINISNLASPTASTPGTVTLNYALASGGAFNTSAALPVVVPASGLVYVNLTTGTTSATATAPWDIAFEGYKIYTNGGVSGSGAVSAVVVSATPYASIDFALASSIAGGYASDNSGGAFSTGTAGRRWYYYDPVGNQVYPRYNTYLVKRGSAVYKVQITSYYATDASPRVLAVRYARIN